MHLANQKRRNILSEKKLVIAYTLQIRETNIDSSFAVQFSISVSKTRAILLFKIKIKIEMFELHQRMPGMSSDLFACEAVIQTVTSA